MQELNTEIEINAPARIVWGLLTDFSRLPEWNPFMQRASGQIKQGEKIEIRLQLPSGPGMTIKPILLKVEPERELRWLGHLFVPGLFDGEHIFTIEPLAEDRVRFIQREEFQGILVSLMLSMIGESTQRGFEAMNQALKVEAENLHEVA
jgi:hypothetical protein